YVFFFFFQAEDGIRDFHVTGVQTCALPILICMAALQLVNLVRSAQFNEDMVAGSLYLLAQRLQQDPQAITEIAARFDAAIQIVRSEERRVGKECRYRGWPCE